MAADPKTWARVDWAILGGAAVAFGAGFLPWCRYAGSIPFSQIGWSSGLSAWVGVLLLALAAVVALLQLVEEGIPEHPLVSAVVVAAISAAGLVLVVARGLTFPALPGLSVSPAYGYWLALLAGIVETTAAVLDVHGKVGRPLLQKQK